MMKYMQLCAASLILTAGAGNADVSVSLGLDLGPSDSLTSVTYDCADCNLLDVSYVNSGANALAMIEIDDDDRIFVNVVSASGARYVSGA